MYKTLLKVKSLTQLLFVTCLLLGQPIQAQFMGGVVQSAADSNSVEGAHIINVTNNEMTISSSKGLFELLANVGDTLVISNIAFETKSFYIKTNSLLSVFLTPANIQLEEVVVSNMPKNAAAFKSKVLAMDMQPSQEFVPYGMSPAPPKAKIPLNYNPDRVNSVKYAVNKPISFLVKKLSKDYKAKVKYYEIMAYKGTQISNDKKFNREIVKQLTTLEGEHLSDFIKFMDVDPSYIQRASEYEIALHIQSKYKLYQSLKGSDSIQDNNQRNG